MFPPYDLIVIGLGHAGAECAHAAAKMGASVLGIDPNRGFVKMSCVAAMGGIAKGQIVREIDALGGLAGIIADKSTLQFRMLNRSKGAAMWSPRTQNDRMHFGQTYQQALEATPGLDFWQDMVQEILIKKGCAVGVKTARGLTIHSKAVVLASGTFLNGVMHIGTQQWGGGRAGERPATGLTAQLLSLGFETGRLKTGTSPRVDGRTLDYSKMEVQPPDEAPGRFSFLPSASKPQANQRPYAHITYTNPRVHALLAKGFDQSPLLTGRIQVGEPRYCPSIERKIIRFADQERHRIFVEAEGWHTAQVYVNGFATSLPQEVQYRALRAIPGFENAKIFSPGYAIAYDYFPPTQLNPTLETKPVANLYFAGQPNGTTGYEEAAAQGLMAGINAYQKIKDQAPFVLARSAAYIGVLIDDLVYQGVAAEPYRMLTARAEHRMLLRQDNADLRLTEKGYAIGLADATRYQRVQAKKRAIQTLTQALHQHKLAPDLANPAFEKMGTAPIQEKQSHAQLLKRPDIDLTTLSRLDPTLAHLLQPYAQEVIEQVAIQIKYADYLQKEQEFVKKAKNLESLTIPAGFNYAAIKGLATEGREKLQNLQPTTLGQAARISGVSPADIAVLMVYIGR